MKKKLYTLTALAFAAAVTIVACTGTATKEKEKEKEPTASVATPDSAARVTRGEYLVKTVGCDDCHSPKKMGPNGPEIIAELRLSGFQKDGKLPPVDKGTVQKGWALFAPDLTAAVGPWGISYAANLTPDETGLANWTEENFIRAIREGKSKGLVGNRSLLPPMPWPVYRNMNDEDLKSIFAYLRTIKPVNNAVPNPVAMADVK